MSNVTYVKLKGYANKQLITTTDGVFLLDATIRINDVFDWLGTGG
jgi:hypothetical protein